MADEETGAPRPGGGDAAAAAIAMQADASTAEDARLYLREQTRLARLQSDNLIEQNAFELSHLRWRRFNDQMKGAMQIMFVALGLLLVVAIGAAMWNASEAAGVVVDSFSVPPGYAQSGTSGDVVADDMTARIAAVRDFASVNSLAQSNGVSEDRSRDVKVEIPETGVSLAEAWRYLKLWLGHERHLTGNIRTLPDGNIALTTSLDGADSFTFTGKPGDLGTLEQKAAEKVFATVDPINIVIYLASKNRGPEALASVAHLVAIMGNPRDLAGAYSLQGDMIRGFTGDARRSLAIVHHAIALDPKAVPQRMEAISAARALGHDEEVLAQARVIATLHPEDNIASWRTGDGFAYVQEVGAEWRAVESGDFAALSVLRCIYVCPRNDPTNATMLHAQGLARLHDIGAARALIGEVYAAGRPDPGDAARTTYFVDMVRNGWRAAATDAQNYAATFAASGPAEAYGKLLVQTRAVPLLARALAAQGDADGAQKAIMKTPLDCYDCVLARGDVAAWRHDWRGAATWYARAVHLAPSVPFAYTNWGAALLHHGAFAAAIAQFDLAHAKGPHFADPLEMWGEVLIAENRSDLAFAKFAEAGKYAPNWGRLHLKWGEALWWSGKRDEARKQFAIAAGLDLTPPEKSELAQVTHG